MANSDKDIKITPNTGQSDSPKIEVTGANATTKTLTINDDGSITFDSDLTVQGDFTVSGTTTTFDTDTLNVQDNTITVNEGETGAGVTAGTAGIEIDRGTETNATILYDESIDGFVVDSKGSGRTAKFVNTHGYIELGPQNTSYAHITTDRARFYFNRDLVIGENAISSYNGDFSVRRSQSTDEQIVIGDDSMTFTSAGNDVVTVDGTNNRVGIATSSPAARLHVNGSMRLADNSSILAGGSGYLQLGNTSSGVIRIHGDTGNSIVEGHGNHLVLQTQRDGDDIRFRVNDGGTESDDTTVEAMIVEGNTGNVGIGTTSPQSRLHVVGETNDAVVALFTTAGGTSGSIEGIAHIGLSHFSSDTAPSVSISAEEIDASDHRADFRINTRESATTNATPTEKMRVTYDGKVGIGTSSPDSKLEVVGALNPTSATQFTYAETLKLDVENSGTATGPALRFRHAGTNDNQTADYMFQLNSDGGSIVAHEYSFNWGYNKWLHSANADGFKPIMRFKHNGSSSASGTVYGEIELVSTATAWDVFDGTHEGLHPTTYDLNLKLSAGGDSYFNGGDVGIGTSSPAAPLDIKSGGSGSRTSFNSVADDLVVDSTGDTGITISSASTSTGNVFFADSDNDARGQIRYDHTGNTMRFSTSGAEVMRLGSNGNVGIGTTSPDSQLHISSGNSGDCTVIIEADEDNNAEGDLPRLWFKADGGINEAAVQLSDNELDIISNTASANGIRFLTGSTSNTGTTDPLTGASVRMDINDNGMRLGNGGARVTNILDEDNMASNSSTALATQQSIKAYVDSQSGGGGSPAGSDSQIQYNNGGSFGGDADFTWDDTNNRLVIGSVTSQHDGLGKLTVKGTDASFLLEKHDDSASGGPTMTLYRYSASVADNDLIGQVNFRGEGSTGNPSTYLSIRAEIEDTTEGTKDGALIFRGLINNTQTNLAEIHGAGLTLNQGTFNGNMGTTTYKPSVYMDTGTQNVNQTEATLGFNSEVLDPASNASSTTDGHIRLAAGGYYRISYSIPINDDGSTGGDRTRVFTFMQVDDNNSFTSPTTVAQSRAQVYTRENSGGSGLSSSFIYQHTANDYIRLRIDAEGTTDISTESNQSQISIEYLGPA